MSITNRLWLVHAKVAKEGRGVRTQDANAGARERGEHEIGDPSGLRYAGGSVGRVLASRLETAERLGILAK